MGPNAVLLVILVVLAFLVLRRGSKQRQQMATVQAGLTPGVEIMTTSGLYARVVSVDGDVLTLETAPGQQSRWDRRAVVRVLAPASSPEQLDDETADDTTVEGTAFAGPAAEITDSDETRPPRTA